MSHLAFFVRTVSDVVALILLGTFALLLAVHYGSRLAAWLSDKWRDGQ